jgi:phospholipase/carboxylesterase
MLEKPIEICRSQKPNASVIWLHGLGADGHDFVPVVEMLDLPEVRFILPHAPFQKITLNNGYEMRAWYDLYGLNAYDKQDAPGIAQSQTLVTQLIAQENDRGIPSNRIVLAGFSQGGAIALHTSVRHKQLLAGVLALSTYLPLKANLAAEKLLANQHTPIFMAHGVDDQVITLETARAARDELLAQNFSVDWREYAMPHSVCNAEINDIGEFLVCVLTKTD